MNPVKTKEMDNQRILILKTPFKDDDEFLDYARQNLLTLLRGWVPTQGDIWRQVPNRRGHYELSRKHDCLEYYRAASAAGRLKKIPLFVYWLILARQKLFNRSGLKRLFDDGFELKANWLDAVEGTIKALTEDGRLSEDVHKRLLSAWDGFRFRCYQRKDTIKNAIVKMAGTGIFSEYIEPIRAGILGFIDRYGVTTLRELRRHKRKLRRIRADVLGWILEDLEKEGRIQIKIFSTRMFLTNGKSTKKRGLKGARYIVYRQRKLRPS